MIITRCSATGIYTASYRNHIASSRNAAQAIRLCFESSCASGTPDLYLVHPS